MAAPIAPGDFVECVNRGDDASDARAIRMRGDLHVGGVYRVRDVTSGFDHSTRTTRIGLLLDGVIGYDENGVEGCWDPAMFRPIHPGGALTKLLMQPIPAEPDLVGA